MLPEVQIMSRKLIKPSAPTPLHRQTHKLNIFDQLAPKLHIPLLYFYPNVLAGDISKTHQQLQKSLSDALCFFHPFAGRMANDGLTVDCSDQGVEYLEAKINVRLSEFLEEGDKNINIFSSLVPWDIGETTAVTTPPLAVQATGFDCGGLAVTVHYSHNIADGFTECLFVREWASLNRFEPAVTKPMSMNFDLASLFPTRVFPNLPSENAEKPKIATKKIVFDEPKLLKLKQIVTNASSTMESTPSRVEVATALLWKALINAGEAKHGQSRPSVVCLPVNLRSRTNLQTPDNSFGNLYILVAAKLTPEENGSSEFHDLAILIRNTIQSTLAECANAASGDEVINSVVFKHLRIIGESIFDPGVDFRLFTSMCRFPLYEADFGWGMPACVTGISTDDHEVVAMMDTKSNGIEARVSLNEVDMVEFEAYLDKEAEIIHF